MSVKLMQNGFSGTAGLAASDLSDSVGNTLIELWTELVVFERQRVRNEYFNGAHDQHVLIVLVDVVDGITKFLFMFDDKDQVMYPPVDLLPSDAELETMLTDLIS